MVVLDTKEIAGPTAVETVRNAKRIGQEEFQAFFTKERLVERSKPLDNAIHHNILQLQTEECEQKKQQTVSLKHDLGLFSCLYVDCQTRDRNLEQFFSH